MFGPGRRMRPDLLGELGRVSGEGFYSYLNA